MSGTITVKYYKELEDGSQDEIILELPSKMEVCSNCDGNGYQLRDGLRGHAFAADEFRECFDEPEDRAEYFKPGGTYDEVCEECSGNNVTPYIDVGNIPEHQKEQYEEYCKYEEEQAYDDAMDRAERAAERRMGC